MTLEDTIALAQKELVLHTSRRDMARSARPRLQRVVTVLEACLEQLHRLEDLCE